MSASELVPCPNCAHWPSQGIRDRGCWVCAMSSNVPAMMAKAAAAKWLLEQERDEESATFGLEEYKEHKRRFRGRHIT